MCFSATDPWVGCVSALFCIWGVKEVETRPCCKHWWRQ